MPEQEPGRWAQIERLYHEALDQHADQRETFLDRACAGDESLRRDVASLLSVEPAAERFLERPALADAARALACAPGPSPLPARIAGYEIRAILGAGGMGVVYHAREIRLERDVALKVLEASVARDPAYRRRFDDEARAASGLSHPNIVTVYGVGEADGTPYIAMELVRGRTLAQVLADGPLPSRAALGIAVPLADALATAHAAGVVHRDLKPENIMVTPEGLVKILDFGIAKRGRMPETLPTAPSRPAAAALVTEPGTILGTAGYMSPEQASGLPAGHQSDQFAFGAILYEMLSGRRAFERRTRADTLAAILREAPAPIGPARDRVAAHLRRVAERCLEKDPSRRYADTRSLERDLRRIADLDRDSAPALTLTRRRLLWLGGGAAVAAFAGIGAWRPWPRVAPIRSLAVLPFANIDGADDSAYLCDGIAEGLIHRLSQLPSLRVMARSLVFNFRGRAGDSRTIGRQLGVDAVLTGTLARREGRLLITADLVEVATGARLWSASFDRGAADTLYVQEEIANAVAEQGMHVRLESRERDRFARRPTDDVEAYELYLRAVHRFEDGGEDDYIAARDLLVRAIGRDRSFALAHAALATTYAVMAVDGFERPRSAWPASSRCVDRAIGLDPDLPDAHAAAASVAFFFDWDWFRADREWNAALQAHGGDVDPTFLAAYALQQWALGRPEAARDLAHRARLMDPLSPAFIVREADLLFHAKRWADAAALYAKAASDAPDDPAAYFGLAETLRAEGRFNEAIDVRRRAHALAGDDALARPLATERGADGYRRIEVMTARLHLEVLEARASGGGYASPLDYARAHAVLGDRTLMFEYLDAAFADRSPGLVFLNVDHAWDAVRGEPLFEAAVRRVGLR